MKYIFPMTSFYKKFYVVLRLSYEAYLKFIDRNFHIYL